MNLRLAPGRRGFTTQEPWIPLVIVVLLAVIAFGTLKHLGRVSRVRFGVERDLAMLADAQTAHHHRYGSYASRIGSLADSGTVGMVADSGAVVTVTHGDSAGWSASGTHPALHGRNSTCYIYAGNVAHDPRLVTPDEPRCW